MTVFENMTFSDLSILKIKELRSTNLSEGELLANELEKILGKIYKFEQNEKE